MGRTSGRSALRISTILLAAAVLAGPAVAPAGAQAAEHRFSRFSGSLSVINAQPLGNLKSGPGIGGALTASWALDAARVIRLRGDVRFASYGRDTRTVCLSAPVGCLIELDVNTDYTSFFAGIGPELAVPVLGSRLVLNAGLGVGGFSVSSSIQGVSDPENESLLTTTNYEDTFLAGTTGVALWIPVSTQVSISLGTQYLHNGEVSYVREGGITTNPDGSLNIAAITTDANQLVFSIGVAFHPTLGWTSRLDDDG